MPKLFVLFWLLIKINKNQIMTLKVTPLGGNYIPSGI
jgi:hypothetical protein